VAAPHETEIAAKLADSHGALHRPEVRIGKRNVYRLKGNAMSHLSPVSIDHVGRCEHAGRRNPSFTYIAGVKEKYLLGIPDTNPVLAELPKPSDISYPVFDITLLKDQEFILGNAETRSHTFEMDIFSYASMTPKVLFETSSSGTKLAMMQKQIAPAFLPQAYINKDDPNRYFRCPPYPSWTTCVATRRDDYLTVPELVLADLIRRYNQNEVGVNILMTKVTSL